MIIYTVTEIDVDDPLDGTSTWAEAYTSVQSVVKAIQEESIFDGVDLSHIEKELLSGANPVDITTEDFSFIFIITCVEVKV